MKPSVTHEPSYLFLGMPVSFSQAALEELLHAGKRPAAIWLFETSTGPSLEQKHAQPALSSLPLVTKFLDHGPAQLGWTHDVDVYAVRDLSSPAVADALRRLMVDVAVVACFPQLVPAHLLAIPDHGFLNLHPSLLPAYRGPFPLFWTLREGRKETGVTLHHMDEGLDTGDIALQARVYLPDGRSAAQLEKLLGKEAGALALKALSILADGPLPRRAQSGTATYNGHPQQADFQISTTWSARRAFNFMRGTSHWNTPYIIRGQNVRLTAHTAIAFDANGTQDVPQRWTEASTTVRFSQGVLEVR